MKRFVAFCAALLFVAISARTGFGDDPDTFSPVVSYQFQESLSESGTQINIVSPVVSFQYFDWPGDANLTFTDSLNVSYYFDGPPQVLTQPLGQVLKVGGTVVFSTSVMGTTPLTYQWRLNGVNLPGTNSPTITLTNAQTSDSGAYSVLVNNVYGTVTSNDAKLTIYLSPPTPQPSPPSICSSTQSLSSAQSSQPSAPSSTQLKVLGSGNTIDPTKMTIVMTHGWNSSSAEWPTTMASDLSSRYSGIANILAWDWHQNASAISPTFAAGRTVSEGVALGNALMNNLGTTYNMPIHFIGHSLGTLVNCAAADYIHGDRRPRGDARASGQTYASTNTQMTLFDEAELAVPVNGLHVSLDILVGNYSMTNGQAKSDANVIPYQAAYVDNYLSEVGLLHSDSVNILLWRRLAIPGISDIPGFGNGLHGYSYEWYRRSIQTPTTGLSGFFWSFENNSISVDPNSATPKNDTFYIQSLDLNQSFLSLSQVDSTTALLLSRDRLVVYPTLQAFNGLSAVGNTVEGVYLDGIRYAGNMAASFAETFAAPTGPSVYLGTAGSTAAYFLPAGLTTPTNWQANWDLQFNIQPGSPQSPQLKVGMRVQGMATSGTGPVYSIIPVHVPTEAVGVSFEYSITGAAVGDFMTMGIGTSNEYTMEADYLDDGAWNGTPVIPISDYRNQDVQLVFALNGTSGTPSGTLSVRNIQFYIPPRPQLTLSSSGNTLMVAWPLSGVDWTLDSSTDLSQPDGWLPVNATPDDTDYFHTMTFDISSTPKAFFRLRK